MNVSRLGIGSFALVALVGCSALDVQLADVGTRFDDSLAAGSAMASRLESYPNTEWSSVPGTGSARFVGKTLITVDAGVLNGTRISGDAVINVSFAGDTVTGTLDDFFGKNSAGKAEPIYGSVNLPTGEIGRVIPNDIFATYAGTISGFNRDLVLSGEASGHFIKTPIVGLELDDSTAIIEVDGTPVAGTVQIVAEK